MVNFRKGCPGLAGERQSFVMPPRLLIFLALPSLSMDEVAIDPGHDCFSVKLFI